MVRGSSVNDHIQPQRKVGTSLLVSCLYYHISNDFICVSVEYNFRDEKVQVL